MLAKMIRSGSELSEFMSDVVGCIGLRLFFGDSDCFAGISAFDRDFWSQYILFFFSLG